MIDFGCAHISQVSGVDSSVDSGMDPGRDTGWGLRCGLGDGLWTVLRPARNGWTANPRDLPLLRSCAAPGPSWVVACHLCQLTVVLLQGFCIWLSTVPLLPDTSWSCILIVAAIWACLVANLRTRQASGPRRVESFCSVIFFYLSHHKKCVPLLFSEIQGHQMAYIFHNASYEIRVQRRPECQSY